MNMLIIPKQEVYRYIIDVLNLEPRSFENDQALEMCYKEIERCQKTSNKRGELRRKKKEEKLREMLQQ